jgi:hypothetical protein
MPSSSLPWSLCADVKSSSEPPRCRSWPRSSPFTCCHLSWLEPMTLSMTQAPSPCPQHPSRVCNNVVLTELATLCTRHRLWARDVIDLRSPWAHSTVILPEPAMLSSPRRPRACNAVEPASSLSPQRRCPPQACRATIFYIFLCHVGPTNPDFHMLHYHIALMCYIATLHWYATLPLTCRIALICYIAILLSYATLHLICCIPLMCYIATLLWYATLLLFYCITLICYILILLWYTTHCYIAFVLLYSDLYECILHCSMMKVG